MKKFARILKGKNFFDMKPDEQNLNNEKKDQFDFDYSNSPLYFSVGFWSAIYKSSLLKDHKITFRKESSLGEDLVFLLDVTTICNKVIYTKEVSYYYVERDSSLSNSLVNKSIASERFSSESAPDKAIVLYPY